MEEGKEDEADDENNSIEKEVLRDSSKIENVKSYQVLDVFMFLI